MTRMGQVTSCKTACDTLPSRKCSRPLQPCAPYHHNKIGMACRCGNAMSRITMLDLCGDSRKDGSQGCRRFVHELSSKYCSISAVHLSSRSSIIESPVGMAGTTVKSDSSIG